MSMSQQLSRRQALTGLTLAGATGMLPIVAASIAKANDGDSAILGAWDRRQKALQRIEARGTYFETETHSPELAEVYDAADNFITKATATTPRGLLVQAWVAMSYVQDSFTETRQRQNALIRHADYDALAKDEDLD
jgi:hypothetical protein